MKTQNAKRIGMYVGVFLAIAIVITSITIVRNIDETNNFKIRFNSAVAENAAVSGNNMTGWLEIYFVDSSTAYATLATNTSATLEAASFWGSSFNDTDDFSQEVPNAATTFYIVVRAQFNKTHAWDYTNGNWHNKSTNVRIAAAGGGVTIAAGASGTTTADIVIDSQNSTANRLLWQNYVWTNGGAGYQINSGGTCTISQIIIEANF